MIKVNIKQFRKGFNIFVEDLELKKEAIFYCDKVDSEVIERILNKTKEMYLDSRLKDKNVV